MISFLVNIAQIFAVLWGAVIIMMFAFGLFVIIMGEIDLKKRKRQWRL